MLSIILFGSQQEPHTCVFGSKSFQPNSDRKLIGSLEQIKLNRNSHSPSSPLALLSFITLVKTKT